MTRLADLAQTVRMTTREDARQTFHPPQEQPTGQPMIHPDGTEEYPEGRPDHLWREYPNGERWYYAGRPDHLWWEDPGREAGVLRRPPRPAVVGELRRDAVLPTKLAETRPQATGHKGGHTMTSVIKRTLNEAGQLYDPIDPALVFEDGGYRFYKIPGVLHNGEGPAARYASGTLVYAVNGRIHNSRQAAIVPTKGRPLFYLNGVRVPAWIVRHPEKITAAKILAQPNTEIATAMLALMSLDRLLDELKPTVIDSDPIIGTLYQAAIGAQTITFLVDGDSSKGGKPVILPLPPEITSCKAASTWLIDLPAGFDVELGNMLAET